MAFSLILKSNNVKSRLLNLYFYLYARPIYNARGEKQINDIWQIWVAFSCVFHNGTVTAEETLKGSIFFFFSYEEFVGVVVEITGAIFLIRFLSSHRKGVRGRWSHYNDINNRSRRITWWLLGPSTMQSCSLLGYLAVSACSGGISVAVQHLGSWTWQTLPLPFFLWLKYFLSILAEAPNVKKRTVWAFIYKPPLLLSLGKGLLFIRLRGCICLVLLCVVQSFEHEVGSLEEQKNLLR